MASLLKNQILKHLSKFTKNLSPDKISLSTLKGEGELSNLELDEDILTELLDLPTWLNIKKASCNHVGIKIQWTKLKSQPIMLCLDEIIVEMETCAEPRQPNKTEADSQSSYRSGGKYGFIDRVLDGIYIRINSVLVKLVSNTFQASVELSRLTVQSMTPRWKPSDNLRDTRLKDVDNDAVILFKEIEWQNTRINASSVNIGTTDFSSPLRLIANQAKIRLTMKKRLTDSCIIATRLELHLDDLLWVLTKTQLREAILYANSLSKIIESSAEQSKQRAAEKLQQQVHHSYVNDQSRNQSPSHHQPSSPYKSNVPSYDVKTTSYHLFVNPINLHLCDDGNNTAGGKERLWNIEGGSMQITIYKLCIDFYPFHPAGSEREMWHNYENIGTRQAWVQKLFAEFRRDAVNIRNISNSPTKSRPGNNNRSSSQPNTGLKPVQSPVKSRSTKLLESCCTIKVKDLAVYMVSTSSTKQSTLHKFLAADKQVPLPSDTCTSLIHIQYTNYFFPEEIQHPVPDANMYVVLRPIRLTVDYTTLLWANYFFMDLSQNVDKDLLESEEPSEHMDIKIETIMPRIIFPAEDKIEGQPERPQYVQLVVSQLTATNVRIEEKSSRSSLQTLLDKYSNGQLFYSDSFPNDNKSYQIIPELLKRHAKNTDNAYVQRNVKYILQNISDVSSLDSAIELHSNTLKKRADCDIWCVVMDTVCFDFLGIHNHKSRPVPFVEAFPLTLWLSGKAKPTSQKPPVSSSDIATPERDQRPSKLKLKQYYSFDEEEADSVDSKCNGRQLADNHVIADIGAKISLQLNHNQYLFLLRLSDSYTRFQSQLTSDLLLFTNSEPSTFCVPLLVPALEVAVISPYLAYLQTFTDEFESPVHMPSKDSMYSPEHRKINIMGHKKQASNSAPNRISINTADSTSSLEDNPNIMITKSMSDSTIHAMPTETCEFDPLEGVAVTVEDCQINGNDASFHSLPRKASSTNAIPTAVQQQEIHTAISFGGDSGVFMDNRGQIAKYSKQVKSAFSFINDRLKLKTDEDTASCDDDSISICTEMSDEDFVQLSLIDDQDSPVFNTDKHSESASITDTYSDDGSSVYAESVAKTKEMVSVTVFKLENPEIILYGDDNLATSAAQIASISTCCYGNTTTDEIHSKLAGKGFFADDKTQDKKQDTAPASDDIKSFPIKLQFIAEPPPPHGSNKSFSDHNPISDKTCIEVHVEGIPLELKMSSITSISEFVEDEILPEIIPMSIHITDLLLILSEDRPSVNIGAPAPPPQNLHIDKLLIDKDKEGVFHLKGLSMSEEQATASDVSNTVPLVNKTKSSQSSSFKSSMILLQAENYRLSHKLTEMNKVKKENEVLETKLSLTTSEFEKLRNENITLADRIKHLTKNISNTPSDQLEEENLQLHDRLSETEESLESTTKDNEALQKTLKFLQNELLVAEQRYQTKFGDKQTNNPI